MPNGVLGSNCVTLDAETKGMNRDSHKVVGLAKLVFECNVAGIDFYLSAEHDQIWASGPCPTSVDDSFTATMDDLHWFWDEEFDSWSTFT